MNTRSVIKSKIKNRHAKIGIVGMGYVGLPLAIRFSQENFHVVGFDIDENKISQLNNGKSYIQHIDSEIISSILNSGFVASKDFHLIEDVDVIIICVPTPLSLNNEPDLSYIFSTLENIKNHLKEDQLLILESTTYPGTTEEEIAPFINKIENKNFIIGKNFYIGYSPEREDPGNKKFSTKNIPKIVSGFTKDCHDLTELLYEQVVDNTVSVSSTKVAEMTKIMENIHRAVNIGLVNELKIVADKMDIDIFEVINAASTKPFGFTPYYPGPGLGGHCIPIDPFYLTWKAKQYGINTRFIELAGEINTKMPEWVVSKTKDYLEKIEKTIEDSNVLILGISYKKNVDDTRETPAFKIIELLKKSKAKVSYNDPYIPKLTPTRNYNFNMKSIDLNKENLEKNDLVILVTDHDLFNYNFISNHAKCIIDTRGRYNKGSNIIRG
tara:strand:- start:6435 stop:7751 length:1317 start_codon:yes stop_codon:yes gene_type:complete